MEYLEILKKAKSGAVIDQKDIASFIIEADKRFRRNEKEIATNSEGYRKVRDEYTLLPAEADDISLAVRRKGVSVMGGKKSRAYKNVNLRQRVYRDIYGEIKRQYGLEDEKGRKLGYKKLKRKHVQGALMVIEDYEPPIAIANEIDTENDLGDADA